MTHCNQIRLIPDIDSGRSGRPAAPALSVISLPNQGNLPRLNMAVCALDSMALYRNHEPEFQASMESSVNRGVQLE